jgi:hypothetical protein
MPFGSDSVLMNEEAPFAAPASPQTPTSSVAMDDTAKAETEAGAAARPAAPKRLKLLKRRKTDNAQSEAPSAPSVAASSSAPRASAAPHEESRRDEHVLDLYVQPDGSHTLTPELPTGSFGDSNDTIALQQDYEEAAKIAQQVEELGKRAVAAKKPDPATKCTDVIDLEVVAPDPLLNSPLSLVFLCAVLDIPEEPGPVDDPEAFPGERVRRRSIDYTNDRITANDFEYAEWPSELVDYYHSVGKGAGGHIDDHEPYTEPPIEDENDYQEIFDKQFADEESEGYVLAERTEAPDPSSADEMLRGDGTDVRVRGMVFGCQHVLLSAGVAHNVCRLCVAAVSGGSRHVDPSEAGPQLSRHPRRDGQADEARRDRVTRVKRRRGDGRVGEPNGGGDQKFHHAVKANNRK